MKPKNFVILLIMVGTGAFFATTFGLGLFEDDATYQDSQTAFLGDAGGFDPLLDRTQYIQIQPTNQELLLKKDLTHEDVESLFEAAERHYNSGFYHDARLIYKKLLDILKNENLTNGSYHSVALNNFAILQNRRGENDDALAKLHEALAIDGKQGVKDINNISVVTMNIASRYFKHGNFKKAETTMTSAMNMLKDHYGQSSPLLVDASQALTHFYIEQGNYIKAKKAYAKTMEFVKATYPSNHADMAHIHKFQGDYAFFKGQYSDALRYYKKAQPVFEAQANAGSPSLMGLNRSLAHVYAKLGDKKLALQLHRKAHKTVIETVSPLHPHFAKSLLELVVSYIDLGELKKAELFFNEIERIDGVKQYLHVDEKLFYQNTKAKLLTALGNYEAASKLNKIANRKAAAYFGKNSANTTPYLYNSGKNLFKAGEFDHAKRQFKQALKILKNTYPSAHPDMAEGELMLAKIALIQNNNAIAKPLAQQALKQGLAFFPSDHKIVVEAKNLLKQLASNGSAS